METGECLPFVHIDCFEAGHMLNFSSPPSLGGLEGTPAEGELYPACLSYTLFPSGNLAPRYQGDAVSTKETMRLSWRLAEWVPEGLSGAELLVELLPHKTEANFLVVPPSRSPPQPTQACPANVVQNQMLWRSFMSLSSCIFIWLYKAKCFGNNIFIHSSIYPLLT